MFNIRKYIPNNIKVALKKRFRVGPYPNWKKITKRDKVFWAETLKNLEGSEKKVLFATSSGGHRSGNITESALAVSLALRGVKPDILLCDKELRSCVMTEFQSVKDISEFIVKGAEGEGICDSCFYYADRMFRDIGIDIRYFSDVISPEDRVQTRDLADSTEFSEIKTLCIDGVSVGSHALSGALRFLCVGDLTGQEYGEEILRNYLYAAVITKLVIERLIEKNNYDCLVFFHGIYIPHGVIGEVARLKGVKVVNWNTAYRQKRFIFTHEDTYHQTLQYEPVENWENLEWTEELDSQIMDYLESRESGSRDWQQFNENANSSLEAAIEEIGIDFSIPTIGLLPNVVWDAQLHYKSNSFENLIKWTILSIEYFEKRPELQLLIRIHPAEIKRYSKTRQPLLAEIRRHYPSLPSNVFVIPPESKISTYTVMDECDSVLIYGTKTGVELTARGVPVIVAGEAWIRNKGFTMDATSPEEYFDLLDKLPLNKKMDRELVKRAKMFAYHFFYRRGIYLPFMEKSKDSMSFTLGVESVKDLLPKKSIGLDVICDGIIRGDKFIYPAELQQEEDI